MTTNHHIEVDILTGPPAVRGFRSGTWTVTVDGRRGKFFASIPHRCDLREQYQLLQQRAVRELNRNSIEWIN